MLTQLIGQKAASVQGEEPGPIRDGFQLGGVCRTAKEAPDVPGELVGRQVPAVLCEAPFVGADGFQRLPDFTIEDAATGEAFLWEHLGMPSSPTYRRSWERKVAWYAQNGVLPYEDGGRERAKLIVTMDADVGGIDSAAAHRLIALLLT
jgi:hypothetical protein